jgi:hypothetical protein
VNVELLGKLRDGPIALTAASATFALKAGVWFRRGRLDRLDMASPDSQATACPPSGRNSTQRSVQNSGATSVFTRAGARGI